MTAPTAGLEAVLTSREVQPRRLRSLLAVYWAWPMLALNAASAGWQFSLGNFYLALFNLAGVCVLATNVGLIYRRPSSRWHWGWEWRAEGEPVLALRATLSVAGPRAHCYFDLGRTFEHEDALPMLNSLPLAEMEERLSLIVDPLTAVLLVSEAETACRAWVVRRARARTVKALER